MNKLIAIEIKGTFNCNDFAYKIQNRKKQGNVINKPTVINYKNQKKCKNMKKSVAIKRTFNYNKKNCIY